MGKYFPGSDARFHRYALNKNVKQDAEKKNLVCRKGCGFRESFDVVAQSGASQTRAVERFLKHEKECTGESGKKVEAGNKKKNSNNHQQKKRRTTKSNFSMPPVQNRFHNNNASDGYPCGQP